MKSMRKSRISSPLVSLECLGVNLVFVEERPHFHAIAANKRANSYNFKIKKKLNLLTTTFLAFCLMIRGKSSYMN